MRRLEKGWDPEGSHPVIERQTWSVPDAKLPIDAGPWGTSSCATGQNRSNIRRDVDWVEQATKLGQEDRWWVALSF